MVVLARNKFKKTYRKCNGMLSYFSLVKSYDSYLWVISQFRLFRHLKSCLRDNNSNENFSLRQNFWIQKNQKIMSLTYQCRRWHFELKLFIITSFKSIRPKNYSLILTFFEYYYHWIICRTTIMEGKVLMITLLDWNDPVMQGSSYRLWSVFR